MIRLWLTFLIGGWICERLIGKTLANRFLLPLFTLVCILQTPSHLNEIFIVWGTAATMHWFSVPVEAK